MLQRRKYTDEQHRLVTYKDPARALVRTFKGIATVRSCPFCNYFVKVPWRVSMGRPNDGGAHSKVAGHIRREHADTIEEIKAEASRIKGD